MVLSHPIDFEAARMQRGALAAPPATLGEVKQHLTFSLQSSLELDKILPLFLHHATRLLPLGGLHYHHAELEVSLLFGDTQGLSYHQRLSHDQEALGELTFYSPEALSAAQQALLQRLLVRLVFPLRNALLYRSALRRALCDPLTGAGNRLALEQSFSRELSTQQTLSILMIDIDHFKAVNDQFGHGLGDLALKAVAERLSQTLRASDRLFRYGGEEFLVILPATDSQQAMQVAERLRCVIQQAPLALAQHPLRVSISVGCATWSTSESAETLQHRADAALYLAKQQGRNRVALALSTPMLKPV